MKKARVRPASKTREERMSVKGTTAVTKAVAAVAETEEKAKEETPVVNTNGVREEGGASEVESSDTVTPKESPAVGDETAEGTSAHAETEEKEDKAKEEKSERRARKRLKKNQKEASASSSKRSHRHKRQQKASADLVKFRQDLLVAGRHSHQ